MHGAIDVGRLLAGAAKTVKSVRYCWLAIADEAGGVAARPMGRLLHDPDEDEWTVRFVTDRRSHKMAGLRRGGPVTLVFQNDSAEAYATLSGKAVLRAEPSEVQRRWKPGYDVYFPGEGGRANALFVEVAVERMALWIRGVTPEPFGLQTTILERDPAGSWRLIGA